MQNKIEPKISNKEYEKLITKTINTKNIKEKSIVTGKVISVEKDIVPVWKKVILRDGLWLLAVEILLLVIIKDSIIDWLDGLLLLIIYALYLFYIFKTMKGGEKVDYDFSLTDKEKVSFLCAFFVFDLRAMSVSYKHLTLPTIGSV